jgi:hypothetical protein
MRRFPSIAFATLFLVSCLFMAIANAAPTCSNGMCNESFTANGSWVAPAGVTWAFFQAWGAGGGGGGKAATGAAGGGGGGAFASYNYTNLAYMQNITFKVGIGGPGGVGAVNGGSGTPTNLSNNSLLSAAGGRGG